MMDMQVEKDLVFAAHDGSARPLGMTTKTDITQAAADGEDLNKVLISQLISQSPGSETPAGPDK